LLQGNYYGISVLKKLKTNGLLETKFQVLTIHQYFEIVNNNEIYVSRHAGF
jgi:hypothetical protein